MENWVEFYESEHSIYVNARHKDVHYREIAEQIAAFVPGPQARVLDHGCGDAVHADGVAAVAGEVLLCDAAQSVRRALAARFADNPKIRVLAPAEVEALPDACLDLVVSNSVAQYLTAAELDRLLALWRRLLRQDGVLIVADVIPPGVGALSDLMALLHYAAANGFLIAAVIGVARTALSSYRKLRARLGITQYSESEFWGKLAAAGFAGERLAKNMEHNPARMSFRAKPIPGWE